MSQKETSPTIELKIEFHFLITNKFIFTRSVNGFPSAIYHVNFKSQNNGQYHSTNIFLVQRGSRLTSGYKPWKHIYEKVRSQHLTSTLRAEEVKFLSIGAY